MTESPPEPEPEPGTEPEPVPVPTEPEPVPVLSKEGICRVCGLRRTVFKINRRIGGPRVRNRVYLCPVCCECAAKLTSTGRDARFDRLALLRLAAYHAAQPLG